MWMLPPEMMCSKHRVGEHGEIHKFKKTFEKGYSISGRIHPVVQIAPAFMKARHDQLAEYLNHNSPYAMPDLSHIPVHELNAFPSITQSMIDLGSRCEECAFRIKEGIEMYKAKLRVCASCEWIFKTDVETSCPQCGFGHYSAHYVYGNRAYRYAITQEPWKQKRMMKYEDQLDDYIKSGVLQEIPCKK